MTDGSTATPCTHPCASPHFHLAPHVSRHPAPSLLPLAPVLTLPSFLGHFCPIPHPQLTPLSQAHPPSTLGPCSHGSRIALAELASLDLGRPCVPSRGREENTQQ